MTTSLLDPEARPSTGFDRRKITHWIAFGFGSGLSPKAPGTVGTLAAIPLYLLMSPLHWMLYVGLVLVFTVAGIWICGSVARDIGGKDPSAIVWDEFVGFLITMLAAPPGWLWILVGFLAFRLFDIWKPWPIRVVDQRMEGGLGIMLDDVIAGVMAALVLLIASWLLI
ncbi:phosphatidylglycerophosphatase A [Thiocystis violacea]|uniref:phosphatidylglycerophosphatase A family protein n=1 Tax=Thiocystis violacea TaxID=13725 RepID=UPI001902F969|nr:phosphatidylglycerophosphatase A [Thiocystis violacea]MBK1718013.1 phosphatidylglycerophosphatase A [Thiocystis violacea]